MQKYYVYIWYLKSSKEVFYVGKGSGNRVTSMKDRNKHFRNIRSKCECDYEIVKYFDDEEEAYDYELKLGTEYKAKGQAWCSYVLGKTDKFVSNETKRKIAKTLKGNTPWSKGKHLSEETKEKIRQAHLGKKQSEDAKKRRSIALMGHKMSKSTCKKIALSKMGEKNPMYGKKQSEETIRKRMAKMIGHEVSEETRMKIGISNGKKVAKIEVGTDKILMLYNSASEAARQNNMKNESISKCCRGERKTSGGFKWQYQ
ncbi:NUMOD3 domain-containing DNA-binding protein [Prevotella melaninogenica]